MLVRKRFPAMGIKIVGEETWPMGGLPDATPVMQKVKAVNPDVVAFMSIGISDCQMVLMKKREFGVKIPFICNGAWVCDPNFQAIGAEVLEGTITLCALFPE